MAAPNDISLPHRERPQCLKPLWIFGHDNEQRRSRNQVHEITCRLIAKLNLIAESKSFNVLDRMPGY
jgi:hypothetical protein